MLAWMALQWSAAGYVEFQSLIPVVAGVTMIVAGAQNMLGGFMLSVICGNEASFMSKALEEEAVHTEASDRVCYGASATWMTAQRSA